MFYVNKCKYSVAYIIEMEQFHSSSDHYTSILRIHADWGATDWRNAASLDAAGSLRKVNEVESPSEGGPGGEWRSVQCSSSDHQVSLWCVTSQKLAERFFTIIKICKSTLMDLFQHLTLKTWGKSAEKLLIAHKRFRIRLNRPPFILVPLTQ